MKTFSIFYLVLLIFPVAGITQGGKKKLTHQQSRPKNIILLIGDGMGTAQIFAGLTANKGWLNLEQCSFVGFHKNQSADNYITDSGAGATAFSTGKKAKNGAIGVDALDKPFPTILELAAKHHLATGLVVSCSITHATPAAFIAHQPSRTMTEAIANDFLKTPIDVFIGGGKKYFNQRKDGKNLCDSLLKKGYAVTNTLSEVVKINSGKLAGFIDTAEPPRVTAGRGDQLLKSLQTALKILQKNKKGFFLMLEGSQIDWGGHANDSAYVIDEMIDFDKAIGEAIAFAKKDKNTLIIITADHETGGLALTGGDMKKGLVQMKFITKEHTAVMIPVFTYGPMASTFSGIYENTDLFKKMKNAFNF